MGYRIVGVGALVAVAIASTPAAAQVRDAVYRGTLVCDKLPFTESKTRSAIRVTIARGTVTYTHVVQLGRGPESKAEQGTGKLEGRNLSLEGSWEGGGRQYKAAYSGTFLTYVGGFVRRSARLKGTQTWNDGGKTITRACSGAVKRPFRIFLPREPRRRAG